MEHVDFGGADEELVAVLHRDVDVYGFGSPHADPRRLHIHHVLQFGCRARFI